MIGIREKGKSIWRTFTNICGLNCVFIVLVVIFICKGVFYAGYLIPPFLGETPDDVGHVSYIQYIVSEKSLPILYETALEETSSLSLNEAMNNESGRTVASYVYPENNAYSFDMMNGENWIVQHPPLYYLIASIIYIIIGTFTNSLSYLIIGLRLLSIVLGVIMLIFVKKTLEWLKFKKNVQDIAIALIVFFGPLQFIFSSVTNDTLLICLSTISMYYLMRYLVTNEMKDYVLLIIACGAIIYTKYTGGLIVLAYMLIIFLHLLKEGTCKKMFIRGGIGAGLGLTILLPLFAFNLYYYGALLVTYDDNYPQYVFSFFEFITEKGYISEMFNHLVVLVGWSYLLIAKEFNEMIVMIFLVGSAIVYGRCYNRDTLKLGLHAMISIIMYGVLFFLTSEVLLSICGASMVMIILSSICNNNTSKHEKNINKYMVLCILIVVMIFVYQHYIIALHRGEVGATHGRYYYILIIPYIYLITNCLNRLSEKYSRIVLLNAVIFSIANELQLITRCLEVWKW